MKRSIAVGAVTVLMGLGIAAQAQNPVANLEPTNPNNFNVNVVDPTNNQVNPVPGLGLERNTQVTWLGGDPVRVVFPGKCYISLPTFQGTTPATTPCCPGTLTQLTAVTVDENACALPAAVPLVPAGGIAGGATPYILLGTAALVGAAIAIANNDDDDNAINRTTSASPSSN